MGKYFGTDGIRGVAFEKLNSELAYKVGQGLVHTFQPKWVVIGMDTRSSSPMLAYSIANGILALGVDVLFAGVVSTPMIANYSKVKSIIGVMITASHNPFMDNGIKIFNQGYKSNDEDELKIEAFIDFGELSYQRFGNLVLSNEIKEEYLKIYEKMDLTETRLKVGFDSANGANYLISKEIFNKASPKAIQISNQPDGQNINLGCGSTHIENIQELVKREKLDIGFSFDGDGDRIIVVDQSQSVYDGDLIIYMISKYLKKKNLLNKNTIVLTKMSNPGILKALKDQGISYSLTEIGDKYVFKELFTHDYSIGGESSGHVILTHLLHSGDGLLVAIYLLKILSEWNVTLEELVCDVELYPYQLTNIKGIKKSVLELKSVQAKIKSIRDRLGENALLLVRASGTEDLIRVTISLKDELLMKSLTTKLVSFIQKEGENL
ncbi:MAG: phosphoglucosamine mutase [Bacillota bacterium]